MFGELAAALDSSGFMPHGHCFLWTPELLWTYVLADTLIAGSYFSIPVVLWYISRKREDLPFRWVFWLFGLFVMACGTTHVFSIWNIWHGDYWIDAGLKLLTAAASLLTAVLLWPMIPKVLALPSPRQLRLANEALQAEIGRRQQVERDLIAANAGLERHAAELEASRKELETFSYSISHDLRVPLRAIDGYSGMLLKRYENQLDGEGQRLLRVVRDNTGRMSQLIDDILALSRTSRHELRFEPCDTEALVRSVWDELQPLRAGREVSLSLASLPPVHGDATLLRQALTNLLANAIKFTSIRQLALIEVFAAPSGDDWVFCVKDNGAGFDQAYADKLFGVFQRLHGTEEFEGTGVGLAIVNNIVARHGGRTWAEGRVDQGASFYFSLPNRGG